MSSSNVVGAHLASRRYVYAVPVLGRATWVVLDTRDPWVTSSSSPILTRHPEVVTALAHRLEQSPRWSAVYSGDGVLVFRRSGP